MSDEPNAERIGDGAEMTIACSHCGGQTPLSSTVCTSCGNPLDSVDPQWAVAATSSGSGGWTKALTGIGCAILVVIAVVSAFFVGCAILFSGF